METILVLRIQEFYFEKSAKLLWLAFYLLFKIMNAFFWTVLKVFESHILWSICHHPNFIPLKFLRPNSYHSHNFLAVHLKSECTTIHILMTQKPYFCSDLTSALTLLLKSASRVHYNENLKKSKISF